MTALKHQFVEFIPDELDDGTIYISVRFATVAHLCCCGCGKEVVTPLSPRDWKMTFDGETISLRPSIGNWSFPCQSHYWIVQNSVCWADQWSAEEIAAGRAYDAEKKRRHYEPVKEHVDDDGAASCDTPEGSASGPSSFLRGLKEWFTG